MSDAIGGNQAAVKLKENERKGLKAFFVFPRGLEKREIKFFQPLALISLQIAGSENFSSLVNDTD